MHWPTNIMVSALAHKHSVWCTNKHGCWCTVLQAAFGALTSMVFGVLAYKHSIWCTHKYCVWYNGLTNTVVVHSTTNVVVVHLTTNTVVCVLAYQYSDWCTRLPTLVCALTYQHGQLVHWVKNTVVWVQIPCSDSVVNLIPKSGYLISLQESQGVWCHSDHLPYHGQVFLLSDIKSSICHSDTNMELLYFWHSLHFQS